MQVNFWLGGLIEVKRNDLYRMKGVLAIEGLEERFVFQVRPRGAFMARGCVQLQGREELGCVLWGARCPAYHQLWGDGIGMLCAQQVHLQSPAQSPCPPALV